MEPSLLQLTSISDSWMSPSSIFIPMDVIFGVLCGVGLFFLLIPFLKTYPVSPPPGSGENTSKVMRRGQSKTRKKAASVKGRLLLSSGEAIPSALPLGDESHDDSHTAEDTGCRAPIRKRRLLGCRDSRENVKDTQNASQPVKSPSKHPLLDPTPHPFWNSTEKPDQLPLSPLLSYLKFLEDLMQQKFNQIFWGMSSMLSESVVATAWVSKRPSSAPPKIVKFNDSCGPFPALPMVQGPSQMSQAQPLPYQFVTPSLAGVTEAQTLDSLPSSTPNQALSSSSRRIHVKACSTSEKEVQASLLTENQSWQQELEWKDTIGSNVQTRQADISQPTHSFCGDTLPTEPIQSASILSEHCQFLQHHEETQTDYRMTMVTEQQDSPSRLLPSQELTELQGHFPANTPSQPEDKPDLSQPAQPSILNSKSSKLSQMMGSVPSRMSLKEGPEKRTMYDSIKEGSSFRAKDLPGTSSSSPGKGLEPRNPALRTAQRSYVNTTQDLSFLDPKIHRKLESNITQLSEKRGWKPYLHTIESRDLTPSRAPVSSFPQIIHPSSSTCGSKAEYYSKAAMILEKLHQRDPGGTRVETVSAARRQSPLFAHSPSEVQEMQRATPPAASHGASRDHPVKQQRFLSSQTRAFSFQARTQPSRIVQGTGRGSLHPSSSPRMSKPALWKRFEDMTSGHPCWRGTMLGPQEGVPPSVVKQTNRLGGKEEKPPTWKVNLGSTKNPNSQASNIHLKHFESTEANRIPGQFQTPTPQHSGDLARKAQVCSEVDFQSSKQPQAWPAGHLPDGQSTVCPTTVSLPSQNSPLSSFQNTSKHPKTSQGLSDLLMRRDYIRETQEFRVTKDKSPEKSYNVFHSNEKREEFLRSRAKSQEERLGEEQSSQDENLNPPQLRDTAITECEPSLDMLGVGQALIESYLKKIIKYILQYLNLNTFSRASLENERSAPATVKTQESVIREKLVYKMAAEVQCLMDVVVQILVNWLGLKVGDQSEAQWHRVEPLTSQVGGSHHSPEGLYDPKNKRPARRMSSGHTSSKFHKHPLMYKAVGDKCQSGIATQEACAQHQNTVKERMVCDQICCPTGNKCRGNGEGQQSGIAPQTACDPDHSRMDYGPHAITKGHNHPFTYRETEDKWLSGIAGQKSCHPK